ncbi:MAG: HAMP domain-containing sensor histidine kinase [Acidobacteriota bacterium]
MRLEYPRTSAAILLTLVAVAIPCGAWLLGGLHQLEQEAALKERDIYSQARKKAVTLAERLATRFELLRGSESRRPFYEYQNLHHDPTTASKGPSVAVSPLAKGFADPLIEAHFQVDSAGSLSLPTLNDQFPELSYDEIESSQCELLWKLRDVAVFSDIEASQDGASGSRWHSGFDDFDPEPEGPARERITRLSRAAWLQHLTANDLYADLQYGSSGGATSSLLEGDERQVTIRAEPFRWHRLPVGGEPALGALRNVTTPDGVWTQGFVLSSAAISEAIVSPDYDVLFEPQTFEPSIAEAAWQGERGGVGKVHHPIEGTPWQVTIQVGDQVAAAASDSAASRFEFLSNFAAVSLGAGLAGLLVVLMVLHSERLARQRSQFAAAAAHELRTPLAGLRLYGEMLAEGLCKPERTADYARRMAGEAERLGRVVSNVLSFTRLEQGGLSLSPEEGRLQEAVREAYQRQRLAIEEAGAQVELRLDDDVPPIFFDRDAISHIVQNLLDNAERYTRDVDDRQIVLSLQREAKDVVLAVADNGRGVSKSLQRKIFRPFARGGDKDAPEGLGLGLVLVKLLASAQGAEITYQDAPRGGAVFRVAFPLEKTGAPPEAPAAV